MNRNSTPPNESSTHEHRTTARISSRLPVRLAGWVLAVGLLAYVVREALRDSSQLLSVQWTIHWWLLGASLLGLVLHFALCGLLWVRIVRLLGEPLGLRNGCRVWAFSQFGRYVPGKVWMLAGRAYLADRFGVRFSLSLASMALEIVFIAGSGLLTGSLLMLAFADPQRRGLSIVAGACGVALLAGLHPKLIRLPLRLLHRVRRRTIPIEEQATYTHYPWSVLLGYCGVWLLFGFWFASFVASLRPIPVAQWPQLGAAIIAAWLLGFLSIVTPAGLGVREASLVFLLQPLLSSGVASGVALASRLWLTAGELLFIALAVLLTRPHPGPR